MIEIIKETQEIEELECEQS